MTRIFRNLAFACLGLYSTGAVAQAITVESGSGLRTQTVQIEVTFTAGADIAGVELDVNFTQSRFSAVTVDCDGQTVGGIDSCSVTGGTVNMNFADSSALATGLMGVISFTIASNAAYGGTALDAVIQSLSNSGGQDLDPNLFSPTDGVLTVLGPTYASTPAAGALNVGSAQQGAGNPNVNVVIDNTGAAGSTLTGTCSETADPNNVFTISGDTSFSVPEAGPNDTVNVACSTASVGNFTGTMSCSHNGTNTTPQLYNLSCSITPGPQPSFNSNPAPGTINLGPVPEGSSPAPTQNISITNNGDPGTTLDGTCSFTGGDTSVITLTSDGAFSVLQGGAADVQTVSCSTANEGPYSATLTCPHDGSNGPNAVFTVNCTIDPPPAPEYSSVPGIGTTLDFGGSPTEEGDPDPTDSIAISNTGDPNSELDVSCTDINDTNNKFSVTGGTINNLLPTGGSRTVTVTCDASAQGEYTATLSCDHNGETATDPATYPLECDIGPPGAAIFASDPVPDSDIDLTDGSPVLEGTNVAPKTLTFFNNADPGDSDLQIFCNLGGEAPPISVTPDISSPITIAPGNSSAVSFDCDTASDGEYDATYDCTYDLGIEDPAGECPTAIDCDGTAQYTVSCDVRDPISIVQPNPPSGTTLQQVVPLGGSHVFNVNFNEVADEGVDGRLETCTLDDDTDFTILSPSFPVDVPDGGTVAVQVEGSDPGGVEQITTVLRCTYSDTNHPYNGDNELGVQVEYTLILIFGGNASFTVQKVFTDGNPGDVTVTISCNTGLPLEQSKVISPGAGVKFIVRDFDSGEMDCSVTEVPVDGYSAAYDASNSVSAFVDDDPENPGCHYLDVTGGNDNFCVVTNSPDPVDVVIRKDWVIEGSTARQGIDTRYRLTLYCDARIVGGYEIGGGFEQQAGVVIAIPVCGLIGFPKQEGGQTASADWCKVFSGDGPEVFEAEVVPEYPSSHCHVVETVFDDAVEVDNGCTSLSVRAGKGGSCVITNTVFFEGIPTLSQYGMALLALLMLGVGLVGFRRYA